MSNWKHEKLSKLCTRIGDGIHGTPEYSEESDIFFINGNNLKNGKIEITENTKRVSQEELNNNFIPLDSNSLLLSINGTLGNMSFYDSEKVMLGKSSAYLNFKTPINRFYYYYFQLAGVQAHFHNVATGSTIKNLSLKSIQDFEVPVPREVEWKNISNTLSSFDAKIELNNKINAELEAMAKALYDYWFVQFDFPYSPPSEGCPQDGVGIGMPYKSSGGKMVYNAELKREIPEGWEVGTLNDLGEIIGGSTPSKSTEDNFCKNGIPWITPKDLSLNSGKKFISRGELDASEKGFKSASLKILPKGSILLSSRAPIGYMVISRNDVTTNQGFKSFIPNKGYSTPFVYYSIKHNMSVIEANASGSTFKEISGGVLKVIPICLASKNIVGLFTEKTQAIFIQQDVIEKQNEQLASLRDWLLPMLMNGQVRVGDVEEELGMVAEGRERYDKQ